METQKECDFVGFVFGWWQRSNKREEETNEEMLQSSVSPTQDQLAFQCQVGVRQMKKLEKEFQTDVTDKE